MVTLWSAGLIGRKKTKPHDQTLDRDCFSGRSRIGWRIDPPQKYEQHHRSFDNSGRLSVPGLPSRLRYPDPQQASEVVSAGSLLPRRVAILAARRGTVHFYAAGAVGGLSFGRTIGVVSAEP